MKKLIIALICGLMLVPITAWGQTWVPPHVASDGTQVEGHWQTPEDLRKDKYSTPGRVNPYTGQFSPYSSNVKRPQPANPNSIPLTPWNPNPYHPQQQDYRFRNY
jgi:hypothetical protein